MLNYSTIITTKHILSRPWFPIRETSRLIPVILLNMVSDLENLPARRWGPVPAATEPHVSIDVSVFTEAIMWGRHNAQSLWGWLVGEKTGETPPRFFVERFVPGEQSAMREQLVIMGVVFYKADGAVGLDEAQLSLLSGVGNPPIVLTLQTVRKGWAVFFYHPGQGYRHLYSVVIHNRGGDLEALNTTLGLLDKMDWTAQHVARGGQLADAYSLGAHLPTPRRAFVWGGLLGVFLGAAIMFVISGWGGGVRVGRSESEFRDNSTKTAGESQNGEEREISRVSARTLVEKALAGSPDALYDACAGTTASSQCRAALEQLSTAPQVSLAYGVEGISASSTAPGVPAFLFRVQESGGKPIIMGVQEMEPPLELTPRPIKKKEEKVETTTGKVELTPPEPEKKEGEVKPTVGDKPKEVPEKK